MKSSKSFIAKTAGLMALVLALFAAGLFLITRDDAPATKLLRQGNDAFAAQNYPDALGAYQLAQNRQPELAEPFYNAANTLYREGSFGDAIVQIQQALLNVQDDELAQNSFYNMGNAAYNGQDLEAAIQSYIEALLINPNDADAKHNLELALQQQQQQQQQEQQQEQENQDQEQQDQEQSEDSEQSEESESQDGEQNEEQQDQNSDQNSENGDNEQDSQNGEGDQQSEDPQDGEGDESDQESEQNQDKKDPSQNGDGEEDEQKQDQPNQGNGRPQAGDPNNPNQNGMVPQPGERMTKEQARQLLMAIAQGSGTLQERLQQIFISPLPPPAQDW